MTNIVIMMSVGSHLNATFCLARNLIQKGFSVTYAGPTTGIYGENLQKNAETQGYTYAVFDPFGLGKNSADTFSTFANNLIDGHIVKRFLNRAKPDIILLDIHFPIYAILFTNYKIPVIFLSTKLLTERDIDVPPLTSFIIPRFNKQSRMEIAESWSAYRRDISPAIQFLLSAIDRGNYFPESQKTEKCLVLFGIKLPEIILWPIEMEFSPDFSFKDRAYHFGCFNDLSRIEQEFDWSPFSRTDNLIYCAVGTVLSNLPLLS